MRSIARQRILYCMKHRHQAWLQVLQHHTRCQAAQWLLVSLKHSNEDNACQEHSHEKLMQADDTY